MYTFILICMDIFMLSFCAFIPILCPANGASIGITILIEFIALVVLIYSIWETKEIAMDEW